jgi:hypothetical protein
MQREMFEMMDLLEDDARKEFERRIRIIFSKE